MNISLGVGEWEESQRKAPGTMGRKLAIALSALTLAALALGNWLEATDSTIEPGEGAGQGFAVVESIGVEVFVR